MVMQVEKTVQLSGADLLIELLHEQQVELIFGYPGGAVLPIYDALYRNPIPHILARHEQGAIHAAEGYARVSGKPGVVIATSGPGATNLVTGIADAMMDSLPLVIFTGQVASTVIGTDAFQEADVLGITQPITKHNYQVKDARDLPRIVREAFHIATTGRPGPVLIDVPKNMAAETIQQVDWTMQPVNLPGYQPTTEPNFLQIQKLAEAMNQSVKPLFLIGAGVLAAKGTDELATLLEQSGVPAVSTLLGLGAVRDDHPRYLGMAGMHGTYAANMAIQECDLLINIGARFDDRLTGNLNGFAPHAKVAHIDIDPAEIGKNVPTAIPIVADAKAALQQLLKQQLVNHEKSDWVVALKQNAALHPLHYKRDGLKAQQVLEIIHQVTKGEAIVATDVGQHQMWTAQYYGFQKPHQWITSGGLGTMGFGFPAAIGAQLAFPEERVIAVVGDAGFQMTLQELSLLQEYRLPVKVVILNNQSLGMVRQWQTAFYEERYSQSLIPVQPDFEKLAAAYSIQGVKIDTLEQAQQQLPELLLSDEPVLIDCRIEQHEPVTPMVAPGRALHEMIGVKPS
ncbi:acetolactate synthase, large subunit, biosynthetic type [Chryseomicrobium excrementi]|uniref:Acetolactate synthase n=1 Tax=Chryseomicrobium excrementi TaxID=2041346 RepID=A0A2M9F3N8_9BACL|nr:biosynthetic-type acetolactate synthase large subunit [Chryseomicrobium excrementi]PJK18083.1 acetolactate synthase, large subunit, biosynthetic type [Chryseomicrobium excrementi]